MDYPRISVITPSYNQGNFIERTICSIFDQHYPNLEYIIIDGGSNDTTIDVIKKYENRITYWISEKDKGQTDAINKGMRKATGEIVCWINSDDVMLPGTLYFVANLFNNDSELIFLNGLTIEIDKSDFIKKNTHIILNKWLHEKGAYNVSQLGFFWKRCLFNRIGYLDDSYHACMDVEWLIRILESGVKIKQTNRPLGGIRVYSETKSAIGGEIWRIDWEKIKNKYNGRYVMNRKSFYFILYVFIRLINGYYLNDIIYRIKYKNKKWMELKP